MERKFEPLEKVISLLWKIYQNVAVKKTPKQLLRSLISA
ncbi:uncharacterized protein METZ01_LOCUS329485 [marine metagenome]|uniref:Uncharacterized protein n=1 Tax=marine metagenome TaxID=408172 RepID=A0A382PXC9_9ZZZZ